MECSLVALELRRMGHVQADLPGPGLVQPWLFPMRNNSGKILNLIENSIMMIARQLKFSS